MVNIIMLCGCVSWLVTALTLKNGPYNILKKFRDFVNRKLGDNSPLQCQFCTSFWVTLLVILLWFTPFGAYIIYFFGIAGIAMALRGMSNEW